MSAALDRRLTKSQAGQLSRRDFALALSGVVLAGPRAIAQARTPAFQARTLNHVTLAVSSIKGSVAFYQKLFGMPVQVELPVPALAVGSGPQFVAVMERPARPVGADHFCFGIEKFDVDRVVKTLAEHGITTKPNMRDGMRKDKVPEIAFRDPDNLTVQIQDVSYCAGSGVLGNLCEPSIEYQPVAKKPGAPPIAVRTLNSVWVNVSDVPRAIEFYGRLLGLSVRTQEEGTTILGMAQGPQFVALVGGSGVKPGIRHFCFGVEGFDANRVMKVLADHGAKGQLKMRGKTQEVYLTDADGITIQLQDVSYCGGSGPLGNVCEARKG